MTNPVDIYLARVTSTPLIVAVVGASVLDSLLKRRRGLRLVLSIGAAAALGVSLGTIRVIVDCRGLSVGLGPWGWPARQLEIEKIRLAEVEAARPVSFAGWGYRVRGNATRVILGPPQALVVHLTDGRTFGITIPDPEVASDILNLALGNGSGFEAST